MFYSCKLGVIACLGESLTGLCTPGDGQIKGKGDYE